MKIIRISAVWCPACLIMRPIMDNIKNIYPNIEHVEYDYDLDEEEVKKYNIGNILPVFIVMNDGKEITRIIGEKKKDEVISILKEILNEK